MTEAELNKLFNELMLARPHFLLATETLAKLNEALSPMTNEEESQLASEGSSFSGLNLFCLRATKLRDELRQPTDHN